MNFENEKELLKLKREIMSKDNNIYLETKKIKDLKKVVYRLRKSHPLSKIPDEKPYKKLNLKECLPYEKILGYTIPTLLLLFMSSWNLKHCCKDGNFLIEINGLIGSLYSMIF